MAGKVSLRLRACAAWVVAMVVASGLAPVAAGAQEQEGPVVEPPAWWADLEGWEPQQEPDPVPLPPVESAPPIVSEPADIDAPDVHRPEAEAADVTLAGEGERRRAGDSPVRVAAGGDAASGRALRVEVLGRDAAARAGATGFVFRVSGRSGSLGDELPVELSVDYSGFRDLYGAGYGDRLRVVALPACALAAAAAPGCLRGGVVVPSHNDAEADELVVEADDLRDFEASRVTAAGLPGATGGGAGAEGADGAGAGTVVLAVTSGTASEMGGTGDFRATPLEVSSDWEVGVGSGEFSWSYDVPVPAPPAGSAPAVGLDYSSGSVDGLTSTRNTQAGQNGLGWSDFASAFIERRYTPCTEDEEVAPDPYEAVFNDLCWNGDNATITLNGRASELIYAGVVGSVRTWRLQRDPRWRVEQLTGGGVANGDNDGERWRVTSPDGTQYFFGLGTRPDGTTATNSVYTVPVVGNHAGEPCSTGQAWCQQGWRWNLDRVVDTNANVTTYNYFKDTNRYQVILGLYGLQPYTNGGRLGSIEYGGNLGTYNGGTVVPAQARLSFGGAYRCASLSSVPPPGAGSCPRPAEASTAAEYPDVPVDLVCVSTCTMTAPSFFASTRYTTVTTATLVGGAFQNVDQVTLTHRHEDNGGGDWKMYLTGVQRTGLSGTTPITLPGVTFGMTNLDNRVVASGSPLSRMPHFRVNSVTDEFGRRVSVTYGQPHPCASTDPPSGGWDENHANCFPQQWTPEGATEPQFGIFNKYLVTQVRVEDTTGGSPAMTTSYAYGVTGDPYPAWHHDADEFTKLSDQSWSDWRGYGTVTVTQGASRTRYRLFRGMHRDRIAGGGETSVTIPSLETAPGMAVTATDFNWLAGQVFDEARLASDGSTLRGTVRTYLSRETFNGDGVPGNNPGQQPHPERDAVWFGEQTATARTRRDGGGFVQTRTTTGYNALLLNPESVYEEGWLHDTADQRCTITTYAANATLLMLDYPGSQTLVSGACSSSTTLSRAETAYDGGAIGAAPTRGNPTRSRTHLGASSFADTTTTYDPFGRPRVVTDPNVHNTTTTYVPASGYPTSTEVRNHRGHLSTTTWNVRRQAPATERDARSKVTTYAYDALGRVTDVWRPTEPTSGPASWHFAYTVDAERDAPPVVRTQQLQQTTPSVVYLDTWTVYDSLLRERQQQRPTLGTGTKVIVTATSYDDRGLVASTSLPQALTGTAGTLVAAPPAWDNATTTTYDELGRPTGETFRALGVSRWSTSTAYGHETTRVTPNPVGGEVVTTLDAYGQPTRVAEWATRGDAASAKATLYGYDMAGRLVRVSDPVDAVPVPARNTISYTYDWAGRRTGMTDRDAGTWAYGYDPAGNQTTVRDARNVTTTTTYDELNRPTARHAGDPARPLATWAYDRAGGNEAGLLDYSTRWVRAAGQPDRAYVVDAIGYDDRARPTARSWVLFDEDVAGLGDTYQVGYGYDRADHVTRVTYPQVGDPQNGGLAQEEVTTTYTSLGLPTSMDGTLMPTGADNEDYLYAAGYDDRLRPLLFGFGEPGSGVGKTWSYNGDQRLSRQQAAAAGTLLQDRELSYEASPAGNVVERRNTINARTWQDCYRYDARNRMTAAYSTSHADDCAVSGAGGGDGPYNHAYTYGDDGNITRRVEDGATIDYSYPSPGGARTHAPTRLDFPGGGDDMDYTWDPNGQMLTRVRGGTTETFTWDPERRLEAVETRNATGSSTASFTYDADGSRIVRRNVERNTAYIEGHEISVNNGGAATVVRTYSLAGQPIATRTAAHGVEYLIPDDQGTVELAARNGESTPTVDRTYDPYGSRRTGGDTLTDRGWIGQIEDDRTNLSYLNARYYDPNLYRFISPDSMADAAAPQSFSPYAYGLNNPVTNEDPSGLCVPVGSDGNRDPCWDARFKSGEGGFSSDPAQADVSDDVEVEPELDTAGFPFWLYRGWHNAVQLQLAGMVGGTPGCTIRGAGRLPGNVSPGFPDVCTASSLYEVKYFGPSGLEDAREQLGRYLRNDPERREAGDAVDQFFVDAPDGTRLWAFSPENGIVLYMPVPRIPVALADPDRRRVLEGLPGGVPVPITSMWAPDPGSSGGGGIDLRDGRDVPGPGVIGPALTCLVLCTAAAREWSANG